MTPQEARMRMWASRGGGIGALQAEQMPQAPYTPQPAASPAAQNAPPQNHEAPIPPEDTSDPDRTYRVLDAIGSGLAGRPYDAKFWQDRTNAQAAGEAANPNSRASMIARKRMAPMLLSLGLAQSDIDTLSAADLSTMSKGGDLVTSLAGMRAKAQASRDARAQHVQDVAEQRAYAERVAAEKAKADAAEFDRRNEITAPQALERAQAVGGMATGRMILGDALAENRAARARAAAEKARIAAEEREAARKQREADEKAARDSENAAVQEEIALDNLEKELSKRPKDAPLPGSENAVSRAYIKAKGQVIGGTGRDDADSRLDTQLTALGLQTYMNKAHNAPNSEREQAVANGFFRGNGTVGSALAAIRARREEIKAEKAARKAKTAGARAAATGDVVDLNDYEAPQ